eukprot:211747-Rhodomonas_salina.1
MALMTACLSTSDPTAWPCSPRHGHPAAALPPGLGGKARNRGNERERERQGRKDNRQGRRGRRQEERRDKEGEREDRRKRRRGRRMEGAEPGVVGLSVAAVERPGARGHEGARSRGREVTRVRGHEGDHVRAVRARGAGNGRGHARRGR